MYLLSNVQHNTTATTQNLNLILPFWSLHYYYYYYYYYYYDYL
jgi:hypothetical protein